MKAKTEKMVRVQYLAITRAAKLQEEARFRETYIGQYWYKEHGSAIAAEDYVEAHKGQLDPNLAKECAQLKRILEKIRLRGDIETERDRGATTECLWECAGFFIVRHYTFRFFHAADNTVSNITRVTLGKKTAISDWELVSESVTKALPDGSAIPTPEDVVILRKYE